MSAAVDAARGTLPAADRDIHLVAATLGFAAMGALWVGMVLGIAARTGWGMSRVRLATLHKAHYVVTLLGLSIAVEHAVVQLLAPVVDAVRVEDLWVPFVNRHDPVGIGLGVLALEALLLMVASVLIRQLIGYHRWRVLHLVGYLGFVLMLMHVVVSGTDVPVAANICIVIVGGITMTLDAAVIPGVSRLWRLLGQPWHRSSTGRQVIVNVDLTRCARLGFCEHAAPEVFHLRTDGRLSYRADISADQLDAAMHAARTCPTRAILLTRLPTKIISGARQPVGQASEIEP